MTATTDRAALYRGILERPDDDVARRVFADYLRENGEEARADFIEVQLRLAEIEHDTTGNEWHETGLCSPYCELCPELRRLNDRESHLWGHGFGGMETPDGLQSIAMHIVGESFLRTGIVSRGFVSAVRCTLADWLRHGPRIVAGQPVEEVRTDAVADPIGDEWCWVKDRPELLGSARIPPEVFNLLEGGRLESGGNEWQDHFGVEDFWRIYPTEAAAQSALSLALINWARRVAGLPPLREHATH